MALLADWFTFPLVFALLARPLGLGQRYVPFIVARNWAAVIIAAMVAVVHALHVLGLVPSAVAPFLLLAAIALALRFSYVIARTTLAVSAGVAIPLVILDLLISLTVWTVVRPASPRRLDNRRAPDRARRAGRPARRRCGRGRARPLPYRPALHLPSPTSFSEPTIERTWLCRKERAEASMTISSPWRKTSSRSSVRTGLFAWHSVERKRGEIVRADQALRGAMHGDRVERPRHMPGPPAIERPAARGG